jgi:hypothetical protein
MELAARGKKIVENPVAAAASRFRMFALETEQKTRTASIEEDKTLATLVWKFKEFSGYSFDRAANDSIRTQVNDASLTQLRYALDMLFGVGYAPRDVERFCMTLTEFQCMEEFGNHAGLFLSALVENGKGEKHTLALDFLERKVSQIGFMNTKNITIRGDAGFLLGTRMSDGIIELDGKVIRAGLGQRGGKIVINGIAGGLIGQEMQGGEIHVNGPAFTPGNINHGKIFHNGKLIVDK